MKSQFAVTDEKMKQILLNLRTGESFFIEAPMPICRPGHLLIATHRSLISAGTERMLVEFGTASLLAKARAQPDKVKQVIDKIKTDGLLPTLEAVFNRLDEPLPLGYCNAGVVLGVGSGVADFKPGDRVVSNGPHAEIVCVPKNLCAKIPDEVTGEQASFTVLSSIGLQGVRLLQPTLGEKIVVYGLGLIGLVTAQLLRASGCQVLGIDINADRLEMAESFGVATVNAVAAGDAVAAAGAWTEGKGVDGVLITASAKTNDIVHQAAEMCRKRGRIVLIGVVGLNLRRADFYEKELTFQVSCSYGPGRYDEAYEHGGHDYPLGFVRWTEQRNFEAVLASMRSGQLVVDRLVTHRFPFDQAPAAYEKICTDPSALGVILQYPPRVERLRTIKITGPVAAPASKPVLAIIGAGNFSKRTMIPALSKTGGRLKYVAVRSTGAAAALVARKFDIEKATTDLQEIWRDSSVNAVFISTGHDSHAKLSCAALEAGKHVFVEKPLCMNVEELQGIIRASAAQPDRQLMVGFNRRFSPHTQKIKKLLVGRSEPLSMTMTVNAGIIPPGHWVHDPVRGGGRIIGEGCHFIDLLSYLAGSPVQTVAAVQMGAGVAVQEDKMSILLGFEDGSVGTVNYFANGSKAYPKELLEVFSEGRVLRLDNFRKLYGYGFRKFRRLRTRRMDKGHQAEFDAFVNRIADGGLPLIPMTEMVNVSLASFAAVASAREKRVIALAEEYSSFSD